ncbi:hypothetical protein WMY93_008597 [Mugilogobius chulae]|uniref:C2H2-type domain-containing protein n=1 Tax=Mugilogobius chulae TaxID=88201 RepID=A0AAW0PSY2_9GOBI
MLGLQGNATSKEYRCAACSATFTGLASLLVHQATHAGSLPKPGPNPSGSSCLQASPASSSVDRGSSVPNVPSTPMYICDCGEEFTNFSIMIEHKQSHVSELLSPQIIHQNDSVMSTDKDLSKQYDQTAPIDKAIKEDSGPSVQEETLVKNITESVNSEEPADPRTEDLSSVSAETEQQQEEVEKESEEMKGNEIDELNHKNKSLMEILASAYGKHLMPQSENENIITLKEEPELVNIAPQITKGPSTTTDMSAMQLKRLLGKPSTKTKAPSISRLLESSTKKIVSLTKIFSPVVLLETRHKFMDPSNSNTYVKYQCARCRRVFQDVDSLTEHHFLHKKERIKCCRCCKQLIIGRVPLPDNHVCPQSRARTAAPYSFKTSATNGQKAMHINNLNNRKKVYFCPICKHNYARRYNLKMHKCRGPFPHPLQKQSLNNTAETHANIHEEANISQSIGVGTRSIKVEDISDPEFEKEHSNLSWSSASSVKELHKKASAYATSFLQEQDSSWSYTSDKDEDGSQWTMPLNNDDLLTSTDEVTNESEIGESVSVTHSDTGPAPVHYFIKDGVRRYPCNKCQQTFCSTCSLSRHKKLCCSNSNDLGSGNLSNSSSINNNVKMYPCYVCGRNFNRKDNMMVHRKKCELRRTMIPSFASEINPSLPPSTAPQDTPQEDDGGKWSIMSLPSVLPRRVTCECGVGFTSPKLLLEHLQKHAQESYTCPTCGVTVNSWADYEIHLQLHMHPQHHKRPQPLLLRFKQPTTVQQSSQPIVPNVAEKPKFRQEQFLHPRKKQQRTVCTKCGKTFASRCSLHRHISWNRCKGLRMTLTSKTYHCSLCNSDFPNAISLLFHQRGGSCKPAIKPVRCPVCLRWFTTTDGLQKHLLAHKNSETFRCDVCQGTYPSLKSLKIHRRRIHRIMVRSVNSDTNEPAISGRDATMASGYQDSNVLNDGLSADLMNAGTSLFSQTTSAVTMLGLQGIASSSKELQCVACSATFTGLASLLVHQASHAVPLPKPESNLSDSSLLKAFQTSSSVDRGSSVPIISSTPMYICDCGEEFADFSVMIEHKQSHVSELLSSQIFHKKEWTSDNELPNKQCDLTAVQIEKVVRKDSAAGSSVHDLSKSITENVESEKPATAGTHIEGYSSVSADSEQQPEEAQEISQKTEGNKMDELKPKNKSLMKILASAYGKHLVPQSKDDNIILSLKEEPELVVIAPQTTKELSATTDKSAMQLKRFYGKTKTKSPSISRLLESSTKKIVSLTKIFSPVVLLETRHKFMDPSNGNTYVKYQCARCRRVFQDVDSLTEHHFLHKNERIKCCRCCKQLIIGRVPLPDNHVCPQSRAETPTHPAVLDSTSNSSPVSTNNVKMYPCCICGRNFNRKDNMMVHKKKCELRRTMIPSFASEINSSLPPSTAPQDVPQEDDGANGLGQLPHNPPPLKIPNIIAPSKISKDLSINYCPSAAKQALKPVQIKPVVLKPKTLSVNNPPVTQTAPAGVSHTPGKGYECRVCHVFFESINVLQRHKCAKAHEFLMKHKLTSANRQRQAAPLQKVVTPVLSAPTVNSDNKIKLSNMNKIDTTKPTVVADDDCFIVESGPEKPAEVIYQVTSSVPIKT